MDFQFTQNLKPSPSLLSSNHSIITTSIIQPLRSLWVATFKAKFFMMKYFLIIPTVVNNSVHADIYLKMFFSTLDKKMTAKTQKPMNWTVGHTSPKQTCISICSISLSLHKRTLSKIRNTRSSQNCLVMNMTSQTLFRSCPSPKPSADKKLSSIYDEFMDPLISYNPTNYASWT